MFDIDISQLNQEQHQALVCMYFAKLPNDDPRYKKRTEYFNVLAARFNRKAATYKNYKDTYDAFFDTNKRQGWKNKKISSSGIAYQKVYDKYKDCDTAVLEQAVKDVIELYSEEEGRFVSMKCGIPKQVHAVLAKDPIVTIDGIYTLADKLTVGNIVFLTLGGDKANNEVDWNPGFRAIAHVAKAPYDYGHDGKASKYFKIDIAVDILLPEPMIREDFVRYRNAYNAPYIGPELRRDPSQAVSTITDKQAVAVVRAALDRYPEIKEKLQSVFDKDFMDRVFGVEEMLIPVPVAYGENVAESMREVVNSGEPLPLAQEAEKAEFVKFGENILFYGVPGSGKSYEVDQYLKEKQNIPDKYIRRVVFHPDYTYSDFVGQIMPVLTADKDGEKRITYKFVSGPFTDILKTAYSAPEEKCCMVIEELNRGNAPAIFGEIFQLLDREDNPDKDNFKGSKYKISNKDIADVVHPGHSEDDCFVAVPPNLSFLATMNTSDQNVFSMDTAFQRRWRMRHIKNEFKGSQATTIIPGTIITWGAFAHEVNSILASKANGLGSTEDKSLGAYFAIGSDFDSPENFGEKVIKYLWDDAFKLNRTSLFKSEFKNLYSLLDAFENGNGLQKILKTEVYDAMLEASGASIDNNSGAEAEE